MRPRHKGGYRRIGGGAMLKRLTLWRTREGVSSDAALAHWGYTHARLVERVPGVRRYVQDRCTVGPDRAEPPFVGVGELWFDNFEAANAALATPEWQAVIEDASTFMDLDQVTAVWAEEDPIF
jgi:uncharacterized protein (TIGR02118 family)